MECSTVTFERVFIADYYDGIISGIANFRGAPHVFLVAPASASDELQRYSLHAITEGLDEKTLAAQELWNPTPAVVEIVKAIVDSNGAGFTAFGDFRPVGPSDERGPREMEVRWVAV